MKQEWKRCLDRTFERRRHRRRAFALLASMSVLVGGEVFWQLRSIGTAMESPDNQPVTTEAQELGCESGSGKKQETVTDWEASLPADPAGTRQEQAARIAESQLGYAADNGYTRYGDWFGSPCGEWNIAFVHFVMHYAGVPGYEIPYGGSFSLWYHNLQSKKLVLTADTGFPARGDVLLTDTDADGTPDRSGIVVSVQEEQMQVGVIEGNLDGAVGQTSYAWDDACICGWVSLAEPEADAETDESVPLQHYEAVSESGITVQASAGPDAFPDGTVMTVQDLPKEEAVGAAEAQLTTDMQLLDAVAVDISFCDADGNELEPAGDAGVQVELTLPPEQQLKGSVFSLLHIADDGTAEMLPDAEVTADSASFTAESFSIYVVTSSGDLTPNDVMLINDQTVPNSQDNPYLLGVGETITIKGITSKNPDSGEGFLWETNGDCLQKQMMTPEQNSDGMWVHQANYTGISAGNPVVHIDSGNEGSTQWCDFYIRVVDNPVYIIKNGNRVLLQEDTLLYEVGDTFILSVNGTNAHLVAPADGQDYNSAYDYNLLYRGHPYYPNGNSITNVEFTCKNQGTQNLLVNGRNITVNIGNNSDHLYIVEDGNRNPIHDSITITVLEGESFTLSVDGYSEHLLQPEGNQYDHNLIHINGADYGTADLNGASVASTNVTYDCVQPGRTTFVVNGKTINVVINPRSQIYVKTSLGIKHKDELHEYLDAIHSGKPWNELVFVNGHPKYIKNGPGDNAYRVSSGEIIEVTSTITEDEYNAGFRFSAGDGNVSLIPGSETATPTNDGHVVITAQFRAADNNNNYDIDTRILLGVPGGYTQDTLYCIITGTQADSNIKTHADIEIDDDGKYILEEFTFDDDGHLIKTITEYSAAVSDVWRCSIFGSDGNPIQFLKDYEEVPVELRHEGEDVVFVHSDYYQHGSLDDPVQASQYEYTSNYVLNFDESQERWFRQDFVKPDGHIETVYLRGNKHFSLADSYSASFNVDLYLKSHRQTVETYDAAGRLVSSVTNDNYTGDNFYMREQDFDLDRQAVLDAYNKCPAHSGLDFTLAADRVMVQFQMKKEFVGGDLSQEHFSFELLDMNNPAEHPNGERIETATTNDRGIVQFRQLPFDEVGTYRYKVHEISDPRKPNIIYAEDREIVVEVYESAGKLYARVEESIAEPIQNFNTYELPATGGTGVWPFMLGGTTIILLACFVLWETRKKRKCK